MDENIVRILASYGCKYMADDNKEMIEEIETYVKNREKQLHIPVVVGRSEQFNCDGCRWFNSCGLRIDYNNVRCEEFDNN